MVNGIISNCKMMKFSLKIYFMLSTKTLFNFNGPQLITSLITLRTLILIKPKQIEIVQFNVNVLNVLNILANVLGF